MRSRNARWILLALVVLLTVGLCFGLVAAQQQKRKKRSRRITNPVAAQPTPTPAQSTDPQIISTADQQTSEQNNASNLNAQSSTTSAQPRDNARAGATDSTDSTQRTINDLSSQVTRLSDKLSQMEQQQRTLVNLERLTRAEQRAETLRAQLSDAQAKQADLQARLEQIQFDLQPENIERTVATFGTTHPEEARAARQKGLENERDRIQAQLDLLTTNRQRLEASIVTADAEVDRLRKLVDETAEPQTTTDTTINTNNSNSTTTTTPPTTQPAPNNATPPL